MVLLAYFLGMMSFSLNPFETLPVAPADGMGLNPLLDNPGMLFHPTTLYLGYVGFTIPFAFAIAALISGRLGNDWIRASRRWTLFAWFALGLGNLFGAQWAYSVLGWGGYWGWDPVENASFMPWLVGTC
jgi:cytochrome c-type biogenesis protein CcmF